MWIHPTIKYQSVFVQIETQVERSGKSQDRGEASTPFLIRSVIIEYVFLAHAIVCVGVNARYAREF